MRSMRNLAAGLCALVGRMRARCGLAGGLREGAEGAAGAAVPAHGHVGYHPHQPAERLQLCWRCAPANPPRQRSVTACLCYGRPCSLQDVPLLRADFACAAVLDTPLAAHSLGCSCSRGARCQHEAHTRMMRRHGRGPGAMRRARHRCCCLLRPPATALSRRASGRGPPAPAPPEDTDRRKLPHLRHTPSILTTSCKTGGTCRTKLLAASLILVAQACWHEERAASIRSWRERKIV